MLQNPQREDAMEDMVLATKMSYGTIYPAMGQLVDSGFIRSRKAGRTWLYSLKTTHVMFDKIRVLIEQEKTVFSDIAKDYIRKLNKTHLKNAILFGSVARMDTFRPGDIDILLITKSGFNKDAALELTLRYHEEKSVNIVLIYLTEREVRSKVKKFDPFILNVIHEGKILYGEKRWLKI